MEDRTAPQHLDCPPTPQQDSPQALGFRKKKMVRWFTPSELIRAGIKAVLSSLFGSYADKREVQALQAEQAGELALIVARRHAVPSPAPVPLPPDVDNSPSKNGNAEALDPSAYAELIGNEVCDYSKHNEVWFDFIADLGDGFDSTYTMARLLAEPRLVVTRDGQKKYETTRGQILLMGGDQVYPTATREEYNDRMVGPYQAALPCVLEDEPPKLFAIPGNHDWYDGLTSFIRLFCQGRWIGGWKTTSGGATSPSACHMTGGSGASTSSLHPTSTYRSSNTLKRSPVTET